MCASSSLCFPGRSHGQTRGKKGWGDSFVSGESSVRSREITVRVVHPGGREELYQKEIMALALMEKYPGMRVARPQVFKHPYESILMEGDKLLIGHKYYMIPNSTVKKLKRKHADKQRLKEPSLPGEKAVESCKKRLEESPPTGEMADKQRLKGSSSPGEKVVEIRKIVADVGSDYSEDSVCSARDFYVYKEKWRRYAQTKSRIGKKTFVPPNRNQKIWRRLEWEPSLDSVDEISP